MRTLHVGLRVADPRRSVAFYQAIGYEIVGEVRDTDIGALTMLKLPDDEFVGIELVHDPGSGRIVSGGLSHLVISVGAVHDFVARLAEQGIDAEPPTSPNGSDDFWTAMLTDPDGYRIELVQWPPGHPAGMTRADFSGSSGADGSSAG